MIKNELEQKILKQIEHINTNQPNPCNLPPIKIARDIFGFKAFKQNGQEEIINNILREPGNVLAIIPTGGGKSACFQIPALIQNNMTVVVSPLIALMKDQIESLSAKGIHSAFFINSSIGDEIKEQIISLIKRNMVKILYIAPESLQSDNMLSILAKSTIDLFVIDEAHCISTWGHNFRPSYLSLAEIIEQLGSPKVLALTATATEQVQLDIQKQLKRNFQVFKASFDRPNLYLAAHNVPDNADKEAFLVKLVKKLNGPSVIFARTRELTENLSEVLNENGIKSQFYHAGLKAEDREMRQNLFIKGEYEIIVATIAFGMGIDKKDIRNIIHYNIPQSVEGYYQEIGRAGRDGDKANCILLYTESDVNRVKSLLASDWPDDTKIRNLMQYLKSKGKDLFFASPKSLEHKTEIGEVPIRLILHRLEETGAIKKYASVPYSLKLNFRHSFEEIVRGVKEKQQESIRQVLYSGYFKNKRKIVNFEELMQYTDLNYFKILEIFRNLIDTGYIEKVKEVRRDLFIVRKDLENFDTKPLADLFEDILKQNCAKVDDLVDCLCSDECIRRKILSYFDEPDLKQNCGMCSNCVSQDFIAKIPIQLNQNFATDKEIDSLQQIEFDKENEATHITLLKAIAIDKYVSAKDLTKIFQGKLHKASANWKFELKSFGLLKDVNESLIHDEMDKLMSEEFVQCTTEGFLRITKKGIEFLTGSK